MAKRTAPVKNTTTVISYIRELPGAVFFGPMDSADVGYALRLQQIRSEYEMDDCQEALWHDLSAMGFDPSEIRKCTTNPAAITSCGYYAAA